ncbi:hypothetical protein BJ508DRAFT_379080 [Ascobolus immersus RN42]|uniref:Uncharacterized protein n=1 Tax=Ascobolus immersus RN42 TaxID=1160509 RepID=A0A3N4I5P5_ASCIM|nr:hypothetical protein BJ508DRAFT_379080 [Ascobolus immersus RN42]
MVKPSILSSFRSFTSSYTSSHHSSSPSSSSAPTNVASPQPTRPPVVETFGTSTTITAARSIAPPKVQYSSPPVHHYYHPNTSSNKMVVIPQPPAPPPKGSPPKPPTIAQRRPLMTMKSLPQITETKSTPSSTDADSDDGLLTPRMAPPRPGSAASFVSTTTIRTVDLENFVAGLSEYDSDDDTISMYGASIYEESIFGDEHDGRNSPTIWSKRAERVLQGAKKKLDNYGQSLNLTPEEMAAGMKHSRGAPIQRPAALREPIVRSARPPGKRTSSSAMGMHSQKVPTSAHFRASSESAVPTLGSVNGGGSPTLDSARGSKSTEQMRALRDQMKDLRGKISHLQQQTRTDSLRRKSVSSLRSTSSAQGMYPSPDLENRPDSAAWNNNDVSHQRIIEEESEAEDVDEIIPTKLTPPPVRENFKVEAVKAETSRLVEDEDDEDEFYDDESEYGGQDYLDNRFDTHTPTPEMMSSFQKREAESRPSTPEYSSSEAGYETASNGSTPRAGSSNFRESRHEDREDAFKYDSLFVNGVFASISELRNRPTSYSSFMP